MSISELESDALVRDQSAAALPEGARVHLDVVRDALAEHAFGRDPLALERGFCAARELVRATVADGAGPLNVDDLRRLADDVPEFGELLDRGARLAGDSVARACGELWAALGIAAGAPGWTDAEHDAARVVLACACGPAAPVHAEWLSESLRRISATRIAGLLCDELARDETAWPRALGPRYASLRHRCAPRTALRSRGLADALRADPGARSAVRARLERWIVAGGSPGALAGELEAAVVHARTPARLA